MLSQYSFPQALWLLDYIVTPLPRPHSLHSRNRKSLTTSTAKESTGWDGNRHRDTSRRRFMASKGSEAQVLTPDSGTYSERQDNRKHLAQFL
ncbi:hypothetical protein E2C01_048172 [Portunus trituberculatus]|uniref:Uncharacterized protein n=1 Tax=Portunus trituberculatus TaxID=210409 RepID=A0A5B7G5Q3_PORTR|nr:hypothetical protein [Portunus trituberculatus]